MPKRNLITATCEACGKQFSHWPSAIRRFCSPGCGNAAKTTNPVIRFWSKVDKNGPLPECFPLLGPCWLWTAGKTSAGYGELQIHRRQPALAHVFAFELEHGPVPEGLELDHKCRVRHCVRVSHLEAVTCRTNVLRGIGPSAINARKTHCIRGHEFSGQNLLIYSKRGKQFRRCRTCWNELNRLYYQQAK
jgi:hypothetical protein